MALWNIRNMTEKSLLLETNLAAYDEIPIGLYLQIIFSRSLDPKTWVLNHIHWTRLISKLKAYVHASSSHINTYVMDRIFHGDWGIVLCYLWLLQVWFLKKNIEHNLSCSLSYSAGSLSLLACRGSRDGDDHSDLGNCHCKNTFWNILLN